MRENISLTNSQNTCRNNPTNNRKRRMKNRKKMYDICSGKQSIPNTFEEGKTVNGRVREDYSS